MLAAKVLDRIRAILDLSLSDEKRFVLFYFDESHNITSRKTPEPNPNDSRTSYQCLCKALSVFMHQPVFTLFLSTYSQLSKFSPSARYFWSQRLDDPSIQVSLHAPFVELGFDIWKSTPLATENDHTVDEVCSLEFMSRFGRPL